MTVINRESKVIIKKIMASNFKLELERIIGQIRYRPNLASLRGNPDVLQDLESDFEEWKAEGNNITLFTPSKKEFLQTGPDTITAGKESDTKERDKLTEEYVEAVFNNSLKAFNLKTMHRIGFRTTLIMKSDYSFTELVDLIYKKFYGSQDKLKELSASDSINDVVYVLVGEMNGLKNRIQIGPTSAEESIKNFQPNFTVNPQLTESNLFIDIDVSSTEVTPDNASMIFKRAAKENTRLLDQYLKYMDEPL